jgi:hypothetical protein
MDLGSLFIFFALVLLTILYISNPFYEKPHPISKTDVIPFDSRLLTEKEYLFNALNELEENYSEQKIGKEDYQIQRELYITKEIEVMEQLKRQAAYRDSLAAQDVNSSTKDAEGDIMNDPLEAIIGERRRIRKDRGAGFCSKCGGPLQKSDRFCWKCGNKTSSSYDE